MRKEAKFLCNTLYKRLVQRLDARVEVATDTNFIEGILVCVTPRLLIIDGTDGYGYGPDTSQYIDTKAVNHVRFLQTENQSI
jgi:hypothetical protein